MNLITGSVRRWCRGSKRGFGSINWGYRVSTTIFRCRTLYRDGREAGTFLIWRGLIRKNGGRRSSGVPGPLKWLRNLAPGPWWCMAEKWIWRRRSKRCGMGSNNGPLKPRPPGALLTKSHRWTVFSYCSASSSNRGMMASKKALRIRFPTIFQVLTSGSSNSPVI